MGNDRATRFLLVVATSEAHCKPLKSSSGCNKNQCTRPVMVMPVSALAAGLEVDPFVAPR